MKKLGGIKLVTITLAAAVKCEICQTNKHGWLIWSAGAKWLPVGEHYNHLCYASV